MRLLSYITRDEHLIGIRITEEAVEAGRFLSSKKYLHDIRTIRIPLTEGVFVDGVLTQPKILIRALREVRSRLRGPRHCVVALPQQPFFIKTLSFPKELSEERQKEAADLAVAWNTPLKTKDEYSDIEYHTTTSHAIITSVARTYIDTIYTALTKAGFIAIAAEPELDALARTLTGEGYYITPIEHSTYTDIAVLYGDTCVFSRSLPHTIYKTKQARTREIKRVTEYASTIIDKKPIARTYAKLPVHKDILKEFPEEEDRLTFLPLLGVMLRARMQRSDDTDISVLPVGTEALYEYQKLSAFTGFISTLAISVMLGITSILGILWWYTQNTVANFPQNNIFESVFDGESFNEKKVNLERFNDLVHVAGTLTKEEISFAALLQLIRTHTIDGIQISSFKRNTDHTTLTLTGTAASRTHLNAFRDNLIADNRIKETNLPITDSELRTAIPFSMIITLETAEDWLLFTPND